MSGQRLGGAYVAVLRSPVARQGTSRADDTPIRVLVVDDEPGLAELLASVLPYEGWDIWTAGDGTSATHAAREFRPKAMVLEIMLSGSCGLEVLRRIRGDTPHVCVLFLAARKVVEDRAAGITEWDDDDYVAKPFRLEEVLARLRGLLRPVGIAHSRSNTPLVADDLMMNEDACEVRRRGEVIERTATEFELLRFLMRNRAEVLPKAQILDRVWQCDYGGRAHVAELHISYLRKKIDAGCVLLIFTVRGVGYISSRPANVLHRH